jgi:hypothetical protein
VGSDITISATLPFRALLPMLTIAGTATIGSERFGATSRQMVFSDEHPNSGANPNAEQFFQ